MRLPMLLSDIVLVFCLVAFVAGLMMIAAASLLSYLSVQPGLGLTDRPRTKRRALRFG